ncbi:hypothetical protein D3C71_314740 [compost metagenome]
MMNSVTFGEQPLANRHGSGFRIGAERLVRREVGHELLANGEVRLVLPAGPFLSDAEARRLAWGLLADLAPDDVVSNPDVVTYREAQRLAVLRAVADGKNDYVGLAQRLDWKVRTVQRRCRELIEDGRLLRISKSSNGAPVTFKLNIQGN